MELLLLYIKKRILSREFVGIYQDRSHLCNLNNLRRILLLFRSGGIPNLIV